MPAKTRLTDKEFVLEHYPNAFADDDGTSVIIRVKKEKETGPCPHCKQSWTRDIPVWRMEFLGASSGTEEGAWENARMRILRSQQQD